MITFVSPNLGLQHFVISDAEPWGLPLNHSTMGQHFKRLGYSTHIVGKVRYNAAYLLIAILYFM